MAIKECALGINVPVPTDQIITVAIRELLEYGREFHPK
jgi:hypothetical protein